MSSIQSIRKGKRSEALSRRFIFACLTLLFALVTPLKTVSQPLAQVNAEECIMACCRPAPSCCCEVSPAKPLVPAEIATAVTGSQSVKFLVIKNSGKLPAVARFNPSFTKAGSSLCQSYRADIPAKLPLYLMNRSLLI